MDRGDARDDPDLRFGAQPGGDTQGGIIKGRIAPDQQCDVARGGVGRDSIGPDRRNRIVPGVNARAVIGDCLIAHRQIKSGNLRGGIGQHVAAYPTARHVALLVWGDPALYDSTLRIAARLRPEPQIRVIPGITSIHALTSAHAIVLNEIGAPYIVTTGRRLRDEGWPAGVDTVVVMLDGECSFQSLPPEGIQIWWGAYVGMPEEITVAGGLTEVAEEILSRRAEARLQHGWIMDIYLMRRRG